MWSGFIWVVWLSLVQVIVCVQNWEECWSLSSVHVGCYRLFAAKARMRNFQFHPGTPRSLYWKQGNNKTKSGLAALYDPMKLWFLDSNFQMGLTENEFFWKLLERSLISVSGWVVWIMASLGKEVRRWRGRRKEDFDFILFYFSF